MAADRPPRKIIHIDCDCFYAAVEMRDDPSLRGLPMAVGGTPQQRGVIATCNYEARHYGVHSAMPTAQALKLCPQLIVLPPAMEKYRAASAQIMSIYREYTDLVEPLSLDEAYLDVSESPHCHGSATLIAQQIRERIAATVGITASAGIAPNKFIAKIASDWRKPNGQFVVTPAHVDAFVAALPVSKLFGVGKVTAEKLQRLGAHTCADLRAWSPFLLQHHFGKFGDRLHELCRGIDQREVCAERVAKSISVEETYAQDIPDLNACLHRLPSLVTKLSERLQRSRKNEHARKLFLKIRFADFQKTTVECIGATPHPAQFAKLLETGFARGQRPVRLLGIGVRLAQRRFNDQLDLFAQ